MKAPVLVVADVASARIIQAALKDECSLTITSDVLRGKTLASTGGFLVTVAVGEVASLSDVMAIDPDQPEAIAATVFAAIARRSATQRVAARNDAIGELPYEEFIGLARYAVTRRYLMALLTRHNGSVTDAALSSNMKRESLHRLLRRHHLVPEEFRDR